MNPKNFIGKQISNFKILKIIGEGAYSTVFLAEETIPLNKKTKNNKKNESKSRKQAKENKEKINGPIAKRYVACKVVPKIKVEDKKFSKRLKQEIKIHQLMRHPNIVHYIYFQQDSSYYYIFLEYVAGEELFQLIKKNGKISEKNAAVYFKQILLGLNYIHSLNVAHRDLKPQNILVDKFGRIKICDFGLSKLFEKGDNNLTKTPCGSPCYVSPECISGLPYNGEKSDIWSCGVILYVMVIGDVPWTESVKAKLFEQIREGDFMVPCDVSNCCMDLIYKLMEVDCNQRISIDTALNHPFLKSIEIPSAKIEFDFEATDKINNEMLENDGKEQINDSQEDKKHIIEHISLV